MWRRDLFDATRYHTSALDRGARSARVGPCWGHWTAVSSPGLGRSLVTQTRAFLERTSGQRETEEEDENQGKTKEKEFLEKSKEKVIWYGKAEEVKESVAEALSRESTFFTQIPFPLLTKPERSFCFVSPLLSSFPYLLLSNKLDLASREQIQRTRLPL